MAGGVDLSLLVAIGVAAVLYLGMLFVLPEPRYVFGPAGPRWVPASDSAEPPVEDNASASKHRVRTASGTGGGATRAGD